MKYLISTEEKSSFKEINFEEDVDTTKEDAPHPESIVSYKLKNSSSKFDKISKMVSFKLNEYEFLAIVRNNYTLQLLIAVPESTGVNYYRLLRTIPLEPENNKDGEDKLYETTMISLGIHMDKFLYAVTEHGEFYLISTKEFEKLATEEIFNETLKMKTQTENQEAEKTKLKKNSIFEASNAQGKNSTTVTAAASNSGTEQKTLKISRSLLSLEFDSDIKVNFINLNCTDKLFAFTSSDYNFGIFAYGGKEVDLKIINIASTLSTHMKNEKDFKTTAEVIFQGKNVKNDRLDLKAPIWISNIAFLNEVPFDDDINFSANFEAKKYKFELLTSTYYGEIRRYDTSHGRKPVTSHLVFPPPFNAPNKKAKIMCMGLLNEKEVIVSDDHNSVIRFDFIKGLSMGKYHGCQGAVHDLKIFGNLLAIGGLDKYLRVYNINSRQYFAKIYAGSRISSILLVDDDHEDAEATNAAEGDVEDDDEESLWEQLDQNNENSEDDEPSKKKVKL